jgi:hypothetical protein
MLGYYSGPESHNVELFTVIVLVLIVVGTTAWMVLKARKRRQIADYHAQLHRQSDDPFATQLTTSTEPIADAQDNEPATSSWTLERETQASELTAIGRLGRMSFRGLPGWGVRSPGVSVRARRAKPNND